MMTRIRYRWVMKIRPWWKGKQQQQQQQQDEPSEIYSVHTTTTLSCVGCYERTHTIFSNYIYVIQHQV